jgi:hypothetical protein
MAKMPMGAYTPIATAKNLAKKYEGKTAAEQESMIGSDRPFFKAATKLGASVRVPNPVDAAKLNAVVAAKKKKGGK